ncbi:hypothetical protein B0T10DRAFT_519053 [Thelonectria olida]|uniref:Uncharacterized protein n=1 Tax=Thelonectria olida TaxID=1576542 RepID=A0A9P8VVQ8_9HYPO|nr:hypothetical protein B0T10DRAFT_519053 [Thelonectria olida]
MGAMAPPPSFAHLEQAASHIVHLIRNTRGLEHTRLAVIGDLAVRKYLPKYEQAKSIDFIVSKSSSPGRVKKEILGHPMSPLVERSGAVFYHHTKGWEIEVKFVPDWLCPYFPTSAQQLKDDDNLPYLSLEDLIVFNLDACGLHECEASKQREARVAAALLELASEHSPLKLDEDKMDRVEQALADVVEFSMPEHDKSWWQRHLGQHPDKQRSPQEILSELSDSFSTPTSPAASTPSTQSSMSRSSSYMSSSSVYSSSSSISSISSSDKKPEEHKRPRKMSVTGRHKRHPSIGDTTMKSASALQVAMKRLELDRPASPGIALTNRI